MKKLLSLLIILCIFITPIALMNASTVLVEADTKFIALEESSVVTYNTDFSIREVLFNLNETSTASTLTYDADEQLIYIGFSDGNIVSYNWNGTKNWTSNHYAGEVLNIELLKVNELLHVTYYETPQTDLANLNYEYEYYTISLLNLLGDMMYLSECELTVCQTGSTYHNDELLIVDDVSIKTHTLDLESTIIPKFTPDSTSIINITTLDNSHFISTSANEIQEVNILTANSNFEVTKSYDALGTSTIYNLHSTHNHIIAVTDLSLLYLDSALNLVHDLEFDSLSNDFILSTPLDYAFILDTVASQITVISHDDFKTSTYNLTQSIVSIDVLDLPPESFDTPVLELNGAATMTIDLGEEYTELGATATDSFGNTFEVTVHGTVNTNEAGIYYVTYKTVELHGLEATPITRKIIVQHNNAPEFTGPATIIKNSTYIAPSQFFLDYFTVHDYLNTDITSDIEIIRNDYTGNANIPGEYIITLRVTDAENMSARYSFKIKVVSDILPLVIIDDNHYIVSLSEKMDRTDFIHTLKTLRTINNETFVFTDNFDSYTPNFDRTGYYEKEFHLLSESGLEYDFTLTIEVIDDITDTIDSEPGYVQLTVNFLKTWWLPAAFLVVVFIGIKKR